MSMPRKTPPRGKAFWPILGFLLALSSAALAFLFTDPVITALRRSLRNFPSDPKVPIIVGVILFALFAMIFSLIVAFAVPRKKSGVTEVQMTKDRKVMVNEKMARKIKQREINRQGKAR
jgi:predicted PurR-regulated permease PerM